ncbi:MAG: Nif3-like dinuclear metal center hexameric protein [Brevinematales bacterium]|nr:Nif3-like dinuclear metal center hexameric protein [Brevinematales bacterium]
MIEKKELVAFLDELLKPSDFIDSTYNGLQVDGKDSIETISFAVDSSLSVFEKAEDFLITHHGLIWGGLKNINSFYKKRIFQLLKNEINLYVSHLPLDFHPEIGNNVSLIKFLDISRKFEIIKNTGILVFFNKEIELQELIEIVKKKINPLTRFYNFNNKKLSEIFISTGAISRNILETLANNGIKNILTGEASSENTFYYLLKEYEINIILAGHYQTEIFGLLSLQEVLKKEFKEKVKYNFIDMPY